MLSPTEIVDSNPTRGMSAFILCLCCPVKVAALRQNWSYVQGVHRLYMRLKQLFCIYVLWCFASCCVFTIWNSSTVNTTISIKAIVACIVIFVFIGLLHVSTFHEVIIMLYLIIKRVVLPIWIHIVYKLYTTYVLLINTVKNLWRIY
jgi:hypothetical protein